MFRRLSDSTFAAVGASRLGRVIFFSQTSGHGLLQPCFQAASCQEPNSHSNSGFGF